MRVGIDIRKADPPGPGQQRYLWRLGEWLATTGHETHFVTVRTQPSDVSLPEAARLHRYHGFSRRRLRDAVNALSLDALLLNPERSRRYRGVPANVLRAGYGTEHYSQKLRSFRSPVERTLRGIWRSMPWTVAEARWERAFYEGTTPPPHVIAQSRYMRRQILDSYAVPEERVHVIHNPVDTDEFRPEARLDLREDARKRWSIDEGAFCLLFLGHNFRLKGLWQLLAVLGSDDLRSRDIHLLVAGSGTGAGQLRKARRLIQRHGLEGRVTLAGAVRSSLEALAASDALIHLSWHDSFGFAPLEGMACGLPVILTPYAGAAELVETGTSGLVVDPDDEDDIAEAIRSLLDPEVRVRMGGAAAAEGARHDEPSNFLRVLGVIEHAVRDRDGPVLW
ncbi:MAG: glycosyltransferase family 4 protein [Longimicrobiales bacterium]|nr:glycosyltransferase family 4 protein [Longimicrobiales bacterium]